jgi:hypothetical protein
MIVKKPSAPTGNGKALLAELPDEPETDAAVQRVLRDIPGLPATPRPGPGPMFSSSI